MKYEQELKKVTVALRSPSASLSSDPNLNTKMSIKMKDVISVFRQNKMDKALGLMEHPHKYRSGSFLQYFLLYQKNFQISKPHSNAFKWVIFGFERKEILPDVQLYQRRQDGGGDDVLHETNISELTLESITAFLFV